MTHLDLLAKYQAQTRSYSNQLTIHQARNTQYKQSYRPTTDLGNSLSTFSINKIPDFSDLLKSANKSPSTNKTPLKPTGNIAREKCHVQARLQNNNRSW